MLLEQETIQYMVRFWFGVLCGVSLVIFIEKAIEKYKNRELDE